MDKPTYNERQLNWIIGLLGVLSGIGVTYVLLEIELSNKMDVIIHQLIK